jgi:hypothetical protein
LREDLHRYLIALDPPGRRRQKPARMHPRASGAAADKEKRGSATPSLYQLFLKHSEAFVALARAADAKLRSELGKIAVSSPCPASSRLTAPQDHCASHPDSCMDVLCSAGSYNMRYHVRSGSLAY